MFTSIMNLDYGLKQSLIICASLLLSVVIAYVSTPFAIKFARKIGAIDVPADERRMHKRPIPLLGGLAIVAAFIVTSVVMMRYHRLLWQILPGAILITILGIVDDKKRLPAWPKFLIQCVAAVIPIIVDKHIVIDSIAGIFGLPRIYFGIFAIPITILWIVGITNAVNLIDGLDGLAVGISGISSISMLLIAIVKMSDPAQYGIAILTAALAGGCLGLLPYNRNPAKVFMGDTGATFLGYTLAVISIQGLFKGYAAISFAAPILVLGLPILDTMVAIIRRLIEHKSPFTADRSHIHHKLIDLGLDQKQAVFVLYTVSIIMGLVALIFAVFGTSTGVLFLFIGLVLIAAVCVLTVTVFKKRNLSLSEESCGETIDESCYTEDDEIANDEKSQDIPVEKIKTDNENSEDN